MKLTQIILEYGEFKAREDELLQKIEAKFGNKVDGPMSLSMGKYSGGRPDDDPLKDKGFGKLTIRTQYSLPGNLWQSIIEFLEREGYNVVQDANWYDNDDDRDYYPDIKFHFSL